MMRQHFSFTKPLFGDIYTNWRLSSFPTQHLIAPDPQPSQDKRWAISHRPDSIMDDRPDVGLVVEDIIDRIS